MRSAGPSPGLPCRLPLPGFRTAASADPPWRRYHPVLSGALAMTWDRRMPMPMTDRDLGVTACRIRLDEADAFSRSSLPPATASLPASAPQDVDRGPGFSRLYAARQTMPQQAG